MLSMFLLFMKVSEGKISAYYQIWYVNKQPLTDKIKEEILSWNESDIPTEKNAQVEYYKLINYVQRYPPGFTVINRIQFR